MYFSLHLIRSHLLAVVRFHADAEYGARAAATSVGRSAKWRGGQRVRQLSTGSMCSGHAEVLHSTPFSRLFRGDPGGERLSPQGARNRALWGPLRGPRRGTLGSPSGCPPGAYFSRAADFHLPAWRARGRERWPPVGLNSGLSESVLVFTLFPSRFQIPVDPPLADVYQSTCRLGMSQRCHVARASLPRTPLPRTLARYAGRGTLWLASAALAVALAAAAAAALLRGPCYAQGRWRRACVRGRPAERV